MAAREHANRVAIAALLAVVSAVAAAQTSTTSLRGTVVDPKAAVVAGANVTLADPAIGFSRTVKTDQRGVYEFVQVPPGTYILSIQAPGFATIRVDRIRLVVNTPATINEKLQMEQVAQTVEVTSQVPLVNTEDASLGHA